MADRLTFFLNKYTIMPFTQFRAHEGSSTNDADNPNTTQTLEYTKDKYNVKIRK
jgi:hypothetical protein